MTSRSAKALTSMRSVDSGRWKLVTRVSTTPEHISGVDEDIGPARTRRDRIRASPTLASSVFQQPDGGRPYRYDPPPLALSAVDRVCGGLIDTIELGMHVVAGDVLDLHGPKRGPSDVQRDEGGLDAVATYLFHETGRNVEARRRRGDASTLASIDGLVPFRVFQWRLNVRRKWHDADFVEPVLFTQPHGAGTVIVRLQDLARYSNSAPAKLE